MKFLKMLFLLSPLACGLSFALDAPTVKHPEAPQEVEVVAPQVTESLKDAASTILIKMIHQAEEAGEFIKDQIPLVLKELLTFNLVLNAFYTASLVAGIRSASGQVKP